MLNIIFIPEIEERALAIPGDVLNSLLSGGIDANDVIARLLEILHLEQESLENPQPETTRFVRNLARDAKKMNRFDVFKLLREITPAGTTGNFFSSKVYLINPFILLSFGDNFCV